MKHNSSDPVKVKTNGILSNSVDFQTSIVVMLILAQLAYETVSPFG